MSSWLTRPFGFRASILNQGLQMVATFQKLPRAAQGISASSFEAAKRSNFPSVTGARRDIETQRKVRPRANILKAQLADLLSCGLFLQLLRFAPLRWPASCMRALDSTRGNGLARALRPEVLVGAGSDPRSTPEGPEVPQRLCELGGVSSA